MRFFRSLIPLSSTTFWICVASAFLLGNLVTLMLTKIWQPFPLSSSIYPKASTEEDEPFEYFVTRVQGHEHVKPLLSVEPVSESSRFADLKTNVAGLIDSLKKVGMVNQVSVYLREFEHGEWMVLNETEQFHPASLIKIPLLLCYLRMAEATPGLLKEKLTFQKPDSIKINTQYYKAPSIEPGRSYTIHELLYYMIAYSDNNATWLLASRFDPSLLKKLFADLGLPEPVPDDMKFTLTAKNCSVFFKAIYNVAYLSPEYSEYAASMLSNCSFEEGFVKGFPEGTKIWHKFGEWRSPGHDYELHESGIVHIFGRPYLLTVMTRGKNTEQLAGAINVISKKTYRSIAAM